MSPALLLERGLFAYPVAMLLAFSVQLFMPTVEANADQNSKDDNLQGQVPKLSFSELRFDFGSVPRGKSVSHSFKFQNTGNGVLHVRSIHAACGCINTQVTPKDTFNPGEWGAIEFDFDSTAFSGDTTRTLTVDSNTRTPSTVSLAFTANIQQEIFSSPPMLLLGEIDKTQKTPVTFTLSTKSRAVDKEKNIVNTAPTNERIVGKIPADIQDAVLKEVGPVRVIKVTTSLPALKAVLEEDSKGQRVVLSFDGNLPIGPLREKISVWNNSRYLKELVIPIVGEVLGHVRPSAKYIEFGVVRKPNVVRRTLKLESDLAEFKVTGVEIEMRKTEALKSLGGENVITISREDLVKGSVINFDMKFPISLKPSAQSVNTSGMFIVRTNDEDYKEIRVPFFGVLRQE